mmetsp:Transcript_104722/g.293548  ORF Transcript_104722/g.293548 Transcript_104722/m.293548 type:complete len:529 (+) Transcript_104722:481-2067(+)
MEAHHQASDLGPYGADEKVLAEQLRVLGPVILVNQDAGASGAELPLAVRGDEGEGVHAPLPQLRLAPLSTTDKKQRLHAVVPEVRVQLPNVSGPQGCAEQALEDEARQRDRARATVDQRQCQQAPERPQVTLLLLAARHGSPRAVAAEAQDVHGVDEREGRGLLRAGQRLREAIHEVLPDAAHVEALFPHKLYPKAEVLQRAILHPLQILDGDAQQQVLNRLVRDLHQGGPHHVATLDDDGRRGILEHLDNGVLGDTAVALVQHQVLQILRSLRGQLHKDGLQAPLRRVLRAEHGLRERLHEGHGPGGRGDDLAPAPRAADLLPQGRQLHLAEVGHDTLPGVRELLPAPLRCLKLRRDTLQGGLLLDDGVLPEDPHHDVVDRHDQQPPRQEITYAVEHHANVAPERAREAKKLGALALGDHLEHELRPDAGGLRLRQLAPGGDDGAPGDPCYGAHGQEAQRRPACATQNAPHVLHGHAGARHAASCLESHAPPHGLQGPHGARLCGLFDPLYPPTGDDIVEGEERRAT